MGGDQAWWLETAIHAAWEAEIGRITVQEQPKPKVSKTS
jgi:hypothetical protein